MPTFQVLIFNYLTAFLVGLMVMNTGFDFIRVWQSDWFWWSEFLGFLFISVFCITGKTAQNMGLSVASVASKMSVIIPVLSGVLLFGDRFNLMNILGVIIALMAVYLTTKKSDTRGLSKHLIWLPLALFLGAGCIDALLKIIQHHYLADSDISLFSMTTFLTAGLVGFLVLMVQLFRGQTTFRGNSVLGGLLLGVPNFFSIFCMFKMLDNSTWNSATIFTFHNVGIVLLSTLLGVFLFKEVMQKLNWLGIVFALVSLVLLSY